MKQLILILLVMYGFGVQPAVAEIGMHACSDRVSADEQPKPDEGGDETKPGDGDKEPDCD